MGRIVVTKSKTFQAATGQTKTHPGQRIAVLNFACPTDPGGSVKWGSSAQEESLCRCSTLYPTINRRWLWHEYYIPNRYMHLCYPIGTDDLIYSPGVVICKTDDSIPVRLPQEKFVKVDVITCAAPNLGERPWNAFNSASGSSVSLTKERQYEIHLKRAKHILHVAAAHGAEILILGAFGCGVFGNRREKVLPVFEEMINRYVPDDIQVIFAIP